MTAPTGLVTESVEALAEALYEHREGALTRYDHAPTSERPVWCCVCGAHELLVSWRAHVAAALITSGAVRVAGEVRAEGVLVDVAAERERQDAIWGEQNHPNGTGGLGRIASANAARRACESSAERGEVTYLDILAEEVAEAFAEADPTSLRAELVQVAAVAVAWVEAIDRHSALVEEGGDRCPCDHDWEYHGPEVPGCRECDCEVPSSPARSRAALAEEGGDRG